jgi:hypothetical protein
MSNALTTFLDKVELPALSDEALAEAIRESQKEDGYAGRDNLIFIDFSGKLGRYRAGKGPDKEDVDPARLFFLEPMTALKGWICWKKGKPVGRVEWPYLLKDREVSRDELDDHGPYNEGLGEGWFQLRGFGVIALDGSGEQCKFSTNTVSAKNAVEDVMRSIADNASKAQPSLPIIRFDKEEFEAQGQKNWKPKFVIEAWVTREAASAYFDGNMPLEDLLNGVEPKKLAQK